MNTHYRTKDLPVAAYLYASGKRLFESEKNNGIIWFLFDDKATCEELVKCFWRREASIDAKSYADALKSLKDLIFSSK